MPTKRKQQNKEADGVEVSEADEAEVEENKPERGRPLKTAAQTRQEQTAETEVKRPRGRPKGEA